MNAICPSERSSRSLTAFLTGAVLALAACFPLAVHAGDIGTPDFFGNNQQGDCWRSNTPTLCRVTFWTTKPWLYIRYVDQTNNGDIHNAGQTAATNWTNAAGPQYVSYSARSNDSWDYFQSVPNLTPFPQMLTFNCNDYGCPGWQEPAGYIVYSNIQIDPADTQCGASYLTHTIAHETGHSLGLAHHGPAGSSQALMTQYTTGGTCASVSGAGIQAPTSTDIGNNPPCSGGGTYGNGFGGIRCIYDYTY